jgi:hypothetical protein
LNHPEPSILLVDLYHFETPSVDARNRSDEIARLAGGCFLEVWIADQYSRIPRPFFSGGLR